MTTIISAIGRKRAPARRPLLIFGWHNVTETWFFDGARYGGPSGLLRQLSWIRRVASVISLPEAVRRLTDGADLPRKAVALSFDDGYKDNLEFAATMLERLDLPATFFLVPEFLSSPVAPWWERLAWAAKTTRAQKSFLWRNLAITPPGQERGDSMELLSELLKAMDENSRQAALTELLELFDPPGSEPPTPMLNWDEARELVRRGFSIGSHSMRHAILPNESPEAQVADLLDSRAMLESGLGAGVELLAYPNGSRRDFDEFTEIAAKKAGYSAALTTVPGWNNSSTPLMELRRFVVRPEEGTLAFETLPRYALHSFRVRRRNASDGTSHLDLPSTTPPPEAQQQSRRTRRIRSP